MQPLDPPLHVRLLRCAEPQALQPGLVDKAVPSVPHPRAAAGEHTLHADIGRTREREARAVAAAAATEAVRGIVAQGRITGRGEGRGDEGACPGGQRAHRYRRDGLDDAPLGIVLDPDVLRHGAERGGGRCRVERDARRADVLCIVDEGQVGADVEPHVLVLQLRGVALAGAAGGDGGRGVQHHLKAYMRKHHNMILSCRH